MIKDFKQEQYYEDAFKYENRGLQEVPLKQIVGSVGKYKDFDSKFRLKHHLPQERLERIQELMHSGKALPPVDLYQIKDEFFVMDGNHRVAAAKSFGRETIKARIIEFIPSKTSWQKIMEQKRGEFRDTTGITDPIELTEVGQYSKLMMQISLHRRALENERDIGVSFHDAALDWKTTIYDPMYKTIEENGMISSFPDRTVADLYAYITYYQWGCLNQFESGKTVEELLMINMEEFRMKMSERRDVDYREMMREITAFVLMDVRTKKESQIIDKLFSFDEVIEVHSVHGNVDIIVKVKLTRDLLSSDAEVISSFVQNKLRSIPGIVRTQTMIPGRSRIKAEN